MNIIGSNIIAFLESTLFHDAAQSPHQFYIWTTNLLQESTALNETLNFNIMNHHFTRTKCAPTLRWQNLALFSPHYQQPLGGYIEKVNTWKEKLNELYPGCILHTPATVDIFRSGKSLLQTDPPPEGDQEDEDLLM